MTNRVSDPILEFLAEAIGIPLVLGVPICALLKVCGLTPDWVIFSAPVLSLAFAAGLLLLSMPTTVRSSRLDMSAEELRKAIGMD